MNTKNKGDHGEEIALKILEQSGYEILERNYRYKKAEIDIICIKGGLLIFVEVKALSSTRHAYPEERVNAHKEKMLLEAAEDYIFAINWTKDIRFDIISINLTQPSDYLHIEDAFY